MKFRCDRGLDVGDVFRHFKGGKYVVLAPFALNTETGENVVVYSSLETKEVFVRPISMFMSRVDKNKYPEVEQEYRFEKIGSIELSSVVDTLDRICEVSL